MAPSTLEPMSLSSSSDNSMTPDLVLEILSDVPDHNDDVDIHTIVNEELNWYQHDIWNNKSNLDLTIVFEYILLKQKNNNNSNDGDTIVMIRLKLRLIQLLLLFPTDNKVQKISHLLTSFKSHNNNDNKQRNELIIILLLKTIESKLPFSIIPIFWKHLCGLVVTTTNTSLSLIEQVIQRLIILIQEGKIQILQSKTNYIHAGKLTLFFIHRFISLVTKYSSSSLQTTTTTNTEKMNTTFWKKIFSCLISSCGIENILETKKNINHDELKPIIQQLTQKVTSYTCSLLFNQSSSMLLIETFLQTTHNQEETFLIQKLHLMNTILIQSKEKSEYIEYTIFNLLPECHPWIPSHLQLFQTTLNTLFQTILKENDDDNYFHLIRWTFHNTHPLSRQVLITIFLLIIYHRNDSSKLITCICQLVLDRRNEKNSILPVVLYKLLSNTKQSRIQNMTRDILLHTYFHSPNKMGKRKKKRKKKKKKRKLMISPCKLSEKYIRTLSPLLECISSNDSFWSNKSMLSWWEESVKPLLRKLQCQASNDDLSHVDPPFSMAVIWSFLTGAMKQDITTTNQQEACKIFFERTGFRHSSIFDVTIRLLVSPHHNDKIVFICNAIRFFQISIVTMAKSNNRIKDQSLLPLIQYVNQQSHTHTSNDIVWGCIQLLSRTSCILHSGSPQQLMQTLSKSFYNFLNSPLPSNWMIVSETVTSFQKFSNGLLSGHKKILLSCVPPPLKLLVSCRLRQQQQNNVIIYNYSNQKTYQFHFKAETIRYSKENQTVCQKYGISSSNYQVGNHVDSIITILPGSMILKLTSKSCSDQPLIILPPNSTISSVEQLSQYGFMPSSSFMVRENFGKNDFNKVKISRASPSN